MKQLRECFCQLCRQTYNDGDKGRPRSVALQLSMNRFQATCELPSSYKNHTLFLSPLFGLLQCCALFVHQLPRRRPFILQISFLILRWGNGNIVHRSSQCRQIQTGKITIVFIAQICSELEWYGSVQIVQKLIGGNSGNPALNLWSRREKKPSTMMKAQKRTR